MNKLIFLRRGVAPAIVAKEDTEEDLLRINCEHFA